MGTVESDQQTHVEESRRRVLQLERELRIRERDEQAARREVGRLQEQVEQHVRLARQAQELSQHIAQLRVEASAAIARADHVEKQVESLGRERAEEQSARLAAERGAAAQQERIAALEKEAEASHVQLAAQQERVAVLKDDARAAQIQLVERAGELEQERRASKQVAAELEDLQGALNVARKQLAEADRLRQHSIAEYAAQLRLQQQTGSALAVAMARVREDIERASSSRAWRYGHGLTRMLARIAGRRRRTQGALATALARIARVESETRGLSEAHGDPSSVGLPAFSAGAGASRSPKGRLVDERSALIEPSALPLSKEQQAIVLEARAALAARLRERLGPPPERSHWPLVSVVVPTRDGIHHLKCLFAGLVDYTDYPALEVIVVDNASTDGSPSYLAELPTPFSLHVIANEENLTFSEANAQGAEHATGELLLFLNNDVEAFEPGWLKELVCALDVEGVAAVGATLLHPERLDGERLSESAPIVQHRAIRFRWQDGMVKAFNSGDGEELSDASFGSELRAPAVTAACMLVGREDFERVNGFGGGYRYGTEDVDLGLKLLVCGGETAGVGRAVLVHRESSSQNRAARDFRRLNRMENRRLFLERWGPRVQREYRLARLCQDPFWTDGSGPHVAITLTSLDVRDGWGDWYSGHEIGDALQAIGWRVTYVQRKGDEWYELPHDLEYVLSLMDPFDLRRVPDHVTTIAWIRNWTERWLERPWFDRADVLLVSSGGSAEIIEQSTGRSTIRFPLAVNPRRFRPQPGEERFAADYVFTGNWWGKDRDIQGALAPREGERVAIYGKDWEQVEEFAPYARGELAYTDLPSLYASAKLVLDDTQGPTLPYGAVNARVFDALATGTLALTNCESGVRELFDEDYPVWSSKETLRARIDELLSDEQRRRSLARRYREIVLTKHTYAHRAAALRRILTEQEQRLSFCVKIGAPNREVAPQWGDLHFATSLLAELRRRGHRGAVQTLDEWEQEGGLTYDVVVHLKGLSRYHPKPGQFNVLWSISHPAELTGEECDGYDLVCVASPLFARELSGRTITPVVVLEQATDPWVMCPNPREDLAHDLAYVANSRGILRPIARDLLPTDRDLAIWGSKWSGLIDTSRVLGEHVPNGEVAHVYSSAGIVLNDHWDDMREHGYISNRIYDALACEAFVISDEVPGLSERFGEAVACFRSPQELHELVDRFLDDPNERRRRARLGRETVLAEHTFAHRVRELLGFIEERISLPGYPRRLRAPEHGQPTGVERRAQKVAAPKTPVAL
jgi:O-antigen biosynthesis protein